MAESDWRRLRVVGVAALVLAVVVVATGPGVERMLHADDRFTSEQFPHPTLPTNGYDSQFFYRTAVSPLSDADYVGGVRYDAGPYRQQRVGYPLVAWVMSGGQQALVPWALVGVNVATFVALAVGAGEFARRRGLSAMWGLALASYPGFVLALRWNLAEVAAGACLVWAAVEFRRRPWVAGVLLAGAVLSRETVIVVPVALAALTVTRWRVPVVTWMPSAVTAAGWQSFLWLRWGDFGPTSQPASNVGVPFGGVLELLRAPPSIGDAAALAVIGGVAAVALLALRQVPVPLAVAWCAAAAMPVLATYRVWWRSLSFTRAAMELVVVSFVVLVVAASRTEVGARELRDGTLERAV